jgi:hypothetical protein
MEVNLSKTHIKLFRLILKEGDNYMALSKLTTDPQLVIQALPDEPTISASALKAKFDEGAGLIKTYINSTLTTEIDAELASVVLGDIPDGTITLTKLSSSLQTTISGKADKTYVDANIIGSTVYSYNNLGGF